MSIERLVDPFNRVIDSFRILVTSRCNYNCIFCHREGVFKMSHETFSPSDYGFIAKTVSNLGILNYKLTGGEPLIRPDIADIIKEIRPYAKEISIVTNGYLLFEKIKQLVDAGLDRINVSLHSINPETYRYITSNGHLVNVLKGIEESLSYNISLKINFLAMRSNIEEFPRVLEFAEKRKINVNVIELIPLGVPRDVYLKEHVSLIPIINYLEGRSIEKYYRDLQNRPVYVLDSGIKVEVVIGYENYLFCNKCSRLRLTPDGYLKPCLYVENPQVNIVESVKNQDTSAVVKAFKEITSLRQPYFKLKEVIQ
ncbi:MAG: GTP 3',8-cyclase MoaA [Desulfurococcaceae archaeon]